MFSYEPLSDPLRGQSSEPLYIFPGDCNKAPMFPLCQGCVVVKNRQGIPGSRDPLIRYDKIYEIFRGQIFDPLYVLCIYFT